jgi:hypothetical protein
MVSGSENGFLYLSDGGLSWFLMNTIHFRRISNEG